MSGDSSGEWRVTTDRERIVEWAAERGVVPVRAERSDGGVDMRLVSDADDAPGERVPWGRFFERFEAEDLALQYREGKPAEGDRVAARLVPAEAVPAEKAATDEEMVERADPGDTVSTQIGTSDTGENEPVTFDRVDTGGTDDTPMSESPRGAEEHALVLDAIHEAPGFESDPEDEYLTFVNDGDETIDLSGWTVENDAGRSYTFPEGVVLDPGERVTLHSGAGVDDGSDRYWGAAEPVWDEDGDVVTVTTADGRRVLREPYKNG